MELRNYFKSRKIGSSGVQTPLIVPAFSSTAFAGGNEVRIAMNDLRSQLTTASLVSAYDIDHGYVDKDVSFSDLVIIDSGNYERRLLESLGCAPKWAREDYVRTIDSVVPLTKIVLVNFDEPGPLSGQLESAHSLFANKTQYLSEFLCKPEGGGWSFIDASKVGERVESLREFSIVGVTEQELGGSLLEKCKTLVILRRHLTRAGLDTPIHVFGCFEPVAVCLFCMLGADIFDGLSWKKYVIRDGNVVYPQSLPIPASSWSVDERLLQRYQAEQNLRYMLDLMSRLRQFANDNDFDRLGLSRESTEFAKTILRQAFDELASEGTKS